MGKLEGSDRGDHLIKRLIRLLAACGIALLDTRNAAWFYPTPHTTIATQQFTRLLQRFELEASVDDLEREAKLSEGTTGSAISHCKS